MPVRYETRVNRKKAVARILTCLVGVALVLATALFGPLFRTKAITINGQKGLVLPTPVPVSDNIKNSTRNNTSYSTPVDSVFPWADSPVWHEYLGSPTTDMYEPQNYFPFNVKLFTCEEGAVPGAVADWMWSLQVFFGRVEQTERDYRFEDFETHWKVMQYAHYVIAGVLVLQLLIDTSHLIVEPEDERETREQIHTGTRWLYWMGTIIALCLCIVVMFKSYVDIAGRDYKLANSFVFGWAFYTMVANAAIATFHPCFSWYGTVVEEWRIEYQESNSVSHPLLSPVDLILASLLLEALGGTRPRLRLNNNKVRNFTPSPTPPPTHYGPSGRKALLVGCNYIDHKVGRLKGCINDVKRMAQKLHGNYQIMILTDDEKDYSKQPTRRNIMNGLQWLVEGLVRRGGNTVFFHFSGHGSQEEDTDGDEIDGLDETICPVDYETAGMISDDILQKELLQRVPTGNRVLAIMDCCHSGTVLDLPYYAIANVDQKQCKMMGDQMSEKNRVDCDAIMISGCEDAATSSDVDAVGKAFVELADPKAGGALTCAFLLAHKQNPEHCLVSLLFAVRNSLKSKGFKQIPQISASQPYDMLDTKFDLFSGESKGNYEGPVQQQVQQSLPSYAPPPNFGAPTPNPYGSPASPGSPMSPPGAAGGPPPPPPPPPPGGNPYSPAPIENPAPAENPYVSGKNSQPASPPGPPGPPMGYPPPNYASHEVIKTDNDIESGCV